MRKGYAGPDATDEEVRSAALANVRAAAGQASGVRAKYERVVTTAVALGCSLREVGEAAGVAHTTVQRIAEAHNVRERAS